MKTMATQHFYYLADPDRVFPHDAPEGVEELLREVWATVPAAKKKDDPTLVAGDRVATPFDGVSFWVTYLGNVGLAITTATAHPGTTNPVRVVAQRPEASEYKRRFAALVGGVTGA